MSDTPETQEAVERWRQGKINIFDEMARLERERDEAQATLTDIHRWIERNHPDGFIDSMTFHQNLERVADRWYERLDIVERERDEARDELRQWQMLCLWGGTPEHVHDFIKGQQTRIYEAQDIEKTCEKLEQERDEARKHLREIEEYGTEEINAAVELRQKLAQALFERDEAREIIRRAKTKFCEEGSDGNIASDMFAILSL
jgi:hypothetical protein